MPRKPVRIAYLVSHPIQYQAPLLRLIAQRPELELKVFFLHQASSRQYFDKGFGQPIQWDLPLLEGYTHETLPASLRGYWHSGLKGRLKDGQFDVLWTHGYSHPTNTRAIQAAHRLGIQVLLRGESTLLSGTSNPVLRAVKNRFLEWCLPRCAGFLSIGTMNREYYRAHGVPDTRLFDMPYAVDNDFFRRRAVEARPQRDVYRASLELEPGRPVILFAGKLLPHKGPMDLLEAYIRLAPKPTEEPFPYLVFAGSGVERDRLEKRANETGWRSIRFLGFQNQTELPRVFDLSDLFVLPSHFEPWGLIVNEVMNAAKPIIVSDAAGCAPDLVAPDENGWLFRAGNVTSLNDALRSAFRHPERLREMGESSLRRISRWGFQEDMDGLVEAAVSVTR